MNSNLIQAAARPNASPTSHADAHNLLIQAGISEIQARAAMMPAITDEPLPIEALSQIEFIVNEKYRIQRIVK